jgi:hypothetical protein
MDRKVTKTKMLLAALERIARYEYRANRQRMVDVAELEALKRTARVALIIYNSKLKEPVD